MNHPSASVLSAVPISDSARRGSPAVVSEPVESRASYVICTNPRSGSWLLAEGLESTGVAGHPREWFHEAAAQALCHKAGLPATAGAGDNRFLAAVKRAGQTANGVFGLKLHYYQFEEVQTKLHLLPGGAELARPRRFEAAFGKVRYLWLTRRDKARQAVSYHRLPDRWLVAKRGQGAAATAGHRRRRHVRRARHRTIGESAVGQRTGLATVS